MYLDASSSNQGRNVEVDFVAWLVRCELI